VGEPLVDCAVDAVGFEARGCGCSGHQHEQPAQVLNDCMTITRAAGAIGIPGLYVVLGLTRVLACPPPRLGVCMLQSKRTYVNVNVCVCVCVCVCVRACA
jgi:hypothetical protein